MHLCKCSYYYCSEDDLVVGSTTSYTCVVVVVVVVPGVVPGEHVRRSNRLLMMDIVLEM